MAKEYGTKCPNNIQGKPPKGIVDLNKSPHSHETKNKTKKQRSDKSVIAIYLFAFKQVNNVCSIKIFFQRYSNIAKTGIKHKEIINGKASRASGININKWEMSVNNGIINHQKMDTKWPNRKKKIVKSWVLSGKVFCWCKI